jgi:hypothetical protein
VARKPNSCNLRDSFWNQTTMILCSFDEVCFRKIDGDLMPRHRIIRTVSGKPRP